MSVLFRRDGKPLASGSSDGTIKLWDVGTHRSTATSTARAGWVYCVAYSPDGKTLASASDDKTGW
jgi:WD40 repeat protein